MISGKKPECYGNLHDEKSEDCQCCLLFSKCLEAMSTVAKVSKSGNLPKSKNELILAICRKYGISTIYHSRSENKDYEISEEAIPDWDISPLLNNRVALKKLFSTELK